MAEQHIDKKQRTMMKPSEDMSQDYRFYCDIYGKVEKRVNEVAMRRRMMDAPYYASRELIKRSLSISCTTRETMQVKSKSDEERCQRLILRTTPAIGRLMSEHNFCYE
jgi:hypothetical protein